MRSSGRPCAKSRTVLFHDPATAEIAKYWVPEVADRVVAARQPFPASQFESQLDPGAVKARYQIGPVDPTIVCVGDLSEPYGQDLLVKALPVHPQEPQAGSACCGRRRLALLAVARLYPLSAAGTRGAAARPRRGPGPRGIDGGGRCGRRAEPRARRRGGRSRPAGPPAGRWSSPTTPPPDCCRTSRTPCCATPTRTASSGASSACCSTPSCAGTGGKGRDKLEERFGWNSVADQVQEVMAQRA